MSLLSCSSLSQLGGENGGSCGEFSCTQAGTQGTLFLPTRPGQSPDPGEPGKGHLVEGCRADRLSADQAVLSKAICSQREAEKPQG